MSPVDKTGVIEVRAFGDLKRIWDNRGWSFPMMVPLKSECPAHAVATSLDIPLEKVEVVFINGRVESLDYPVRSGDRVAFVPPGTPGPYRVLLGIVGKKNWQEGTTRDQ